MITKAPRIFFSRSAVLFSKNVEKMSSTWRLFFVSSLIHLQAPVGTGEIHLNSDIFDSLISDNWIYRINFLVPIVQNNRRSLVYIGFRIYHKFRSPQRSNPLGIMFRTRTRIYDSVISDKTFGPHSTKQSPRIYRIFDIFGPQSTKQMFPR